MSTLGAERQRQYKARLCERGDARPCARCEVADRVPGRSYCSDRAKESSKEYYRNVASKNPKVKERTRRRNSLFRRSELLKRYGLTEASYEDLWLYQGGRCAICQRDERMRDRRTGRLHSLVVDHDHESGTVRGLLCSDCNKGIGLLGDSVEGIKSALEYLNRGFG